MKKNYFREGFCPVSLWIVLLLLSSIEYTLSGRSFLSGLTFLQSLDRGGVFILVHLIFVWSVLYC